MKHDPAIVVKRPVNTAGTVVVTLAGDAAPGWEASVTPFEGPDERTYYSVTVWHGCQDTCELWPYRSERDALEAARHQLEVSCGDRRAPDG